MWCQVRPMQNQFPLCSVTVRRAPAAEDESTAESGPRTVGGRNEFAYELVVQQVSQMLLLAKYLPSCAPFCCITTACCLKVHNRMRPHDRPA